MVVALGAVTTEITTLNSFSGFDVGFYHCYALGFWQGEQVSTATASACQTIWAGKPQRFRTLPREYPAFALAVFSLPLLIPGLPYSTAYALWIGLIILVATGLLLWRAPPSVAIAFLLYIMLAGWGFILGRYDIVPGLCVLLSIVLIQQGKYRSAAVALAVGTLLKLFPIVLLPAILIACKRAENGRWRFDIVATFLLVCLLVLGFQWMIDHQSLATAIQFELARPTQIESLPGSLLWILSGANSAPPTAGGGPSAVFSYNSLNVVGGSETLLTMLALGLGVVCILLAYWRLWQGKDTLPRTCLLALIGVLIAGKVFSPQYILWALPVAAAIEGLRLRWLAIAVFIYAITSCYQTISLNTLPWSPPFLALILGRNLALVGIAIVYLASAGDRVRQTWPTRSLLSSIWEW